MDLTPLQSILADIFSFFTVVIGDWIPYVTSTIANNPLLIIYVAAVPIVGISVGLFNRIVHSN